MAKKFTAEEDKYILEHWQDGDWSVIADVLGRTSSSVRQHANKLSLTHSPRKSFTEAEDDYIRTHYQNETYTKIGEVLGRTRFSIQRRADRLGLRCRAVPFKFTPEEDEWLKEIMPKYPYRDVVKMFVERFGKTLTKRQLHGHNYNVLKVDSGHKGNKQYMMIEPIGYEYTNPRGYTYVKVSDTGNQHRDFKAKHQIEYEKCKGQLPEGYIVVFLDGDKNNFSVDNLYAISKRIHSRLCLAGIYEKHDRDLTLAAIKTWELHYAVKDAKDI